MPWAPSESRIIFQHLVPNSLAPIIVAATLGFGGVIIQESALSFLGFGIMPPVPTWGNMLNEARGSPLDVSVHPGAVAGLLHLRDRAVGQLHRRWPARRAGSATEAV